MPFDAPLFCRREYPELSATDAWTEIAVGDVLTTLCSPRGTVQNGSLSQSVDNKSARQPCELFDTDSEKRSGSKLTNAGRLSSQKPPAPVHAVCVGTRPQRRQHLAGVFCLSVGEGAAPDLAVARGAGV